MNGCPICGIPTTLHDQTFTGQRCNLLKPLLRIAIPVRKALTSVVEWMAH